MFGVILVFLGGGLGAVLRHLVNIASARWIGASFPWATMIENVSGSLALGLLAGVFALKSDASQHLRLFLATGVLGGYTTFSAFSLETVLLYQRGEVTLAAFNIGASIVLAIGGLIAGLAVARIFA